MPYKHLSLHVMIWKVHGDMYILLIQKIYYKLHHF
jgi:hypothetical protein